uniref:Putative scf ubiquitin ligase skp2 component n=1 Tax=Culex tarsalis TaxID=7177 RepID=A0A1Q3G2C8_CULTA
METAEQPDAAIPSTSGTTSSSASGRKRKLSTDECTSEQPNMKILSKGETLPDIELQVSLLDLSDEILMEIFLNLDSDSLIALSECCLRLNSIMKDKKLWTKADFSASQLGAQELLRKIHHLKVETKSLKIRGLTSVYPLDKWKTPTLTANMLAQINKRCPGLEHFEIIEGYMDTNNMAIISFPQSIKTLVFRKCEADRSMASEIRMGFLSKIDRTLQKLEELTIEYCSWFDTHDFMALSKVPHLRYLSLKGCANMKDSVPYASIATRFGFKKLETLDLRDTPISDSDVSCFNIVQSLKELLLECPEYLRTERGLNEYNEAERQRVEQLRRIANQDIINPLARRPAEPAGGEGAANQQENGAAQQGEGDNAAEPAPPPRPPRPHFLGEGRNVFRFVNRHFFPNLHENPGENIIRIINRAEMDPPAAAAGAAANQQPEPQANGNNGPLDHQDQQQPQRPAAPPLAPLPPLPDNNNQEIRQRHVRIVYNNRRNIIRIINHLERNNNVEDNNNDQQQNAQQQNGQQPQGVLPPPVEAAYQQIFEAGNRDRVENGPVAAAAAAQEQEQQPAVAAAPLVNGIAGAGNNENGNGVLVNGEQPEQHAPAAAAAAANDGAVAGPAPVAPDAPEPPVPQEDMNVRVILHGAIQNNHPRIMPHVIIVRGVENNNPVAEVADQNQARPANAFYQYLNLGPGAPGPNYVSLVSDRGICAYGVSRHELGGAAFIREYFRPNLTSLERLLVRNYKLVTDTSLDHLESAAPNLKLLDVTGTSVTAEGVRNFKLARPNCTILSDFE